MTGVGGWGDRYFDGGVGGWALTLMQAGPGFGGLYSLAVAEGSRSSWQCSALHPGKGFMDLSPAHGVAQP